MFNKSNWTNLLPGVVRNKIESRPELKKIIENVNWLFIDKAIQAIASLTIGILVIRYLGPDRYGALSYALAFSSIFGFLSGLNISSVAIRELINSKFSKGKVLGTSFILRLVGSFIAITATITSAFLLNSNETLVLLMITILSFKNLFIPLSTINDWFSSKVKSKYIVIANNSAVILAALLKVLLIVFELPLVYFATAVLAETILSYVGLTVAYHLTGHSFKNWGFSKKAAIELTKSGWPLFASSIFLLLYKQMDVIFVKNLLGNNSLGNYAASINITNSLNFIATAILTSIFPAIIYSKRAGEKLYKKRIQHLYDFMVWLSIPIVLVIFLLANPITNLLLGQGYELSGAILSIHIWSLLFFFLLSIARRVMVAEDTTRIHLYTSAINGLSAITLNLLLIPVLGVMGSAYAAVFSSFITFTSLVLFKSTRSNVVYAIKSLNFPRVLKQAVTQIKR